MPARRGAGRPTKFTEELAERICEEVTEWHSLRRAIDNNPDLPHKRTVYRWLAKGRLPDAPEAYHEFAINIIAARAMGAEDLIDEIRDIADGADTDVDDYPTPSKDEPEREFRKRVYRWLRSRPEVVRVRVGTYQWLVEKHAPARFGSAVTLRGAADAPLRTVREADNITSQLTDEDKEDIQKSLWAAIQRAKPDEPTPAPARRRPAARKKKTARKSPKKKATRRTR